MSVYDIYKRRALACILMAMSAFTACSLTGPHNIPGNEHLSCTPELRFIEYHMTCAEDTITDWPYRCEVTGVIENAGSGEAVDVLVRVVYGKEFNGVRSGMFISVGDLSPGVKAEFKYGTEYYEFPPQYDISAECRGYNVGN